MTRYISAIKPLDGNVYNLKDLEAIKDVSYENNVLTFTKQNGDTLEFEIRSASDDVVYLDDNTFLTALFAEVSN